MRTFEYSINFLAPDESRRNNIALRSPSEHNLWRLLAVFLITIAACGNTRANPPSLGWLEWSWLEPGHIKIKTKLDTGAKTSSLHAVAIEEFERDGARWVRFRVPLSQRLDDSDHGRDLVVEREVVRETRIKDHVLKSRLRVVVDMKLCIGGKVLETPVTLADRSHFNYPLLLGRSALAKLTLVDPSRIFTASKSCSGLRPSKPSSDA